MWDEAEMYYQNKKFDDSIIALNKIINLQNLEEKRFSSKRMLHGGKLFSMN